MREFAEFRIDEEFASLLFADNEGKRLGDSVRKVKIETRDERYNMVGELQHKLKQSLGRPFFYGWSVSREYSAKEIDGAKLFNLKITPVFEPAGEECGTIYDDSKACSHCGAGAIQVSPLFIDEGRIPRSKDISKTIAGEIVVSRRFADVFLSNGITGIEFLPIFYGASCRIESKDWFQLSISDFNSKIVDPTRVGIGLFDDDINGEYRCPEGDLLGLSVTSEIYIAATSRGENDVFLSRQFIGARRGLLRPNRMMLISPKVRRLIESTKLKGAGAEVAYLV